MSAVIGMRAWEGNRDDDGYRNYTAEFLVKGHTNEGPARALHASGLPTPGSLWSFGIDTDSYAHCKLGAKMKALNQKPGEIFELWIVQLEFSSKPWARWCKDVQIEDPLLQPMKISGGSKTTQREINVDRWGYPTTNSAHELFRGPQIEFDYHNSTIKIEQNVPNLQLYFCESLINTVNEYVLWGCPPRTVKLDNFSWTKNFWGTCFVYYTRVFEFAVDARTWDKDLLDEGTKVLNGRWDTKTGNWQLLPVAYITTEGSSVKTPVYGNPSNPRHFIRFKDRHGENTRVMLNGAGLPIGVNIGFGTGSVGTGSPAETPFFVHIEYYEERDYLPLGIPTVL